MMRQNEVLVIDRSRLFLAIVRYFLHMCGNGRFAVQTASAVSDVHNLTWLHPDLVLTGIKKPGKRLGVITHLRQQFPQAGIIVLPRFDRDGFRAAAVKAGADACVSNTNLHTGLLPTMFAVLQQRGRSVPADVVVGSP
jgi:DNA-binding NarL/FixJ family response regulator